MPMGRPPKPTRVKAMNGNPGRRPLNEREPMPKRGRPPCPKWLSKEAKDKWRKLVPELDRLRLLTKVDGDALATYCQAWAEFRQATEVLEQEGRYTTNAAGTRVSHPAVIQQRTAWKFIKEFSALFGLDPSSRSRLSAPASDEVDELDTFLGETG